MTEIWKDVKGYEGLYQVSNLGRCRSLDRVIPCSSLLGDKKSFVRKGKILKEGRYSKGRGLEIGYVRYSLTKDKKAKNYCIHKLVAEAFIPNPNNKPYVDHIDTNTLNNRVENLRWVSASENNYNHLTNKKRLKYSYLEKTAAKKAVENGMNIHTFYNRVSNLKWSVEKALSTPVISRNK